MKLIPVTLNGAEPFVRLSLKDARLEDQALRQGLWRTVVELKPGAYQASFRTSLWERKESFVVLPDDEALTVAPQQIDSILVRSAVPLQRTSGFSEPDAAIAAEIIGRGPARLQGPQAHGSLFLMLRNPAPDLDVSWAWEGITVIGDSGKPAVDLARVSAPDLPAEVVCAYVELPAGAYRLCLAAGDKAFLSQYLFLVPGFQTRVFMLAARRRNSNAPSSPSVWANARVSVHFAPDEADFDSSSHTLLAAEELMNILEEDIHPETGPEWTDLVTSAQSPALELAFCLTRTDPWRSRFDAPPSVLGSLGARLVGVPDVTVLTCAGADDPGITRFRLLEPPMTACAWAAALWAEARDKLAIPAHSRCARIAVRRIESGRWLRFASSHPAFPESRMSGREIPSGAPDLDFLQMDLKRLVESLRQRVRAEAAMRIPYRSADFSVAERRFLDLLCPEADNLTWRILRDSGKSASEAAAVSDSAAEADDNGPSGADKFPSRAKLVEALHLPTRAIEALAIKTITRISSQTLLPTREQLETFVCEESALNSAVLEPLQVLSERHSKVMHCAEDKPLSLLSLVYLRYRGPVGRRESKPLTFKAAAGLLNGLGFIVQNGARDVSPADIRNELKEAESSLSAALTTLDIFDPLPPGDGIAERLEITFADPMKYKPGSLCRVRIQPPNLMYLYNQWWKTHEFSYSLSLGMASDPSRWGHVAEGTEHTSTAAPVEIDPDAARRYFEMVQQARKLSDGSLEMRLEALDES